MMIYFQTKIRFMKPSSKNEKALDSANDALSTCTIQKPFTCCMDSRMELLKQRDIGID